MYTLEQLLKKKTKAEECSGLPIEDFIGLDGWILLIESHIEALKNNE